MTYELFQILVEESNRAVHGCREVFGDIVVVALIGILVSDAARIADLPRQTPSMANDN